jgi:Helicase HerA, central domain/TraM recognition site of TraD and TraG
MATRPDRYDLEQRGDSFSQQEFLPFIRSTESVTVGEVKNDSEIAFSAEADRLPVVLVREHRELEQFEGNSAIELLGIAWNSRRTSAEANDEGSDPCRSFERDLRSLLIGLRANQSLDIIYSLHRRKNGQPIFNWRIVSRVHSPDPKSAVKESESFWKGSDVFTASVGRAYRFAPTIETEKLIKQLGGSSLVTISPAGILISPQTSCMGFVKTSDPFDFLLAIPYSAGKPTKSISSLIHTNQSVELVLSFHSFTLSKKAWHEAAEALAWLRNGSPKKLRYCEGITISQDELLASLEKNLENWTRNPRGYRVSCEVKSEKPLPLAFLHRLGSEVFSGRPFTLIRERQQKENPTDEIAPTTNNLDLRDCFNDLSELPSVFPDLTSLINLNVNRFYPLPPSDLPQSGALLGQIDDGWSRRDVRLKDSDRGTHLALVGCTGTGKSTVLHSLLSQSIESGDGIVLLDPHGSLYRQALESVPARRASDVVLIDFTDFERAVGINFLETSGPYKQMLANFASNEMIKIFDRLYDLRLTGGPMFETYMRCALMLILDNEIEGGTLVEVPRVFEDSEYRHFLIDHCRSPYVKSFWTNQAERASGESSLANISPYITSKLNQFTQNPLVRAVIGQSKSTINFREILDSGKILLVNLSKGLLSQLDAQLLGMLILGRIFAAAMERAASSDPCRKSFVFVDEFGNFATDTAAYMLSESRKFGLNLTVAFQNLAQLNANEGKQNLLESLLGNVGSVAFFRVGPMDADKLSAYTRPDFAAEDLQDLPNHHAVARLLIDNQPSRPFVFQTVVSSRNHNARLVQTIVDASRIKHTIPISEVEEEILNRRTKHIEMASEFTECAVVA